MKVTPYVINRGSSSEYWGLKSIEEDPRDSQVMRTPKWKSKQAAIKWAKKNGYYVVESSTRSSRKFVVSATNVSCSDLTDDEAQTLYVLSEFASDVIRDIEKDYGKKLSPDGWGKVMDYTESITRDPNMYRMTGNDIESAKLHLESVICDIYEDDTGITGIYESEDIKCSSRRKYTQAKATVPEESAGDFKKFLDSIGVDYTTEDVPNGVEFMYGIYVGSKESNRIDKYLDKITSSTIRGGKEMNKRKFVIKASRDSSFKTFDVTTSATNEVMKGWDGKSFVDIARQCSTIEPHSAKGTIITVADRKGNTRSYEVIRKGAVRDVTGDTHEERHATGASASAKRRFTVTAASSAAEKDLYDDLYSYADQYRMTSRWTKEIVTKYLERQKSFRRMSDSDFQKVVDRVNRDFKRKKKVKSDPYSDMSYKSGVESSESAKRRFTVSAASRVSKPTATEFDTPVSVDIIFDETGKVISSFDDVIRIDEVGNRFYTYHDTKIGRNGQWEHSWVTSQFSYDVKDGSVESAKSIKCATDPLDGDYDGFKLFAYDVDGADVDTSSAATKDEIEDALDYLFSWDEVDTVDIYAGDPDFSDAAWVVTRDEYNTDLAGRLEVIFNGMDRDRGIGAAKSVKCGYDLGADSLDTEDYTVEAYYGYNGDKFRGLESGIDTSDWSEVESFAHEKLMSGLNVRIDGPQGVLEITADEYTQAWEDGAADFDINDEIVDYKRRIVESSTDITAARRDTTIDKEAVRELVLYITNDGDLYRQRVTPMIENLKRKVKKGVYDREKAVKLWQYLADEGVKKYGKEFGPGASVAWLNPATREEIARKLRDYYEEEVMWEDSPVEASSYMIVPDSGTVPFDSDIIDILAYYGYSTIEDFALATGITDFVKAKQILLEKYAEDTGSGYPSSLWDGKSENEIYADLPEAGFIDDDTPYL